MNPSYAPEERARLARIQHLWFELNATKRDSREYEELSARIRQEADAFIAAIGTVPQRGANR